MSSRAIGSQEPRIAVLPRQDDGTPFGSLYTDGPDAAALLDDCGMRLDEWQRAVLSAWLARRDDDTFACLSCGLSVPRQNGKNALLEARELYGLVACGERVLHTAHRVDTARKAFMRLAKYFEPAANPELADMVRIIRRTNGQEAIELSNGGSVEFSSRVNGGSRGSTYDVVVFDEAQELTDDQMEAIMSTMAASPNANRQLVYTGTPPSPVSPGTVFRRKRDDALAGKARRGCWHEWSVEEVGDVSDRSRWYETNPALGIRLDEDFTCEEKDTLTPEGFARERLGWWTTAATGDAAFSEAEWRACEVPAIAQADDEVLACGVKFSPDGNYAALSMCVKGEVPAFECALFEPTSGGIAGLAEWVCGRKGKLCAVVIDGRAHADALAKRLADGGMPKRIVYVATPRIAVAAASMLTNGVRERTVAHSPEPLLASSALGSVRRRIGSDGQGFGSGSAQSEPLESAALALWGAQTSKYNPRRKLRVSI